MKKLSTKKMAAAITQNRKNKKLTQAQLAGMTGIHRGMIGRLENMDYIPSIIQLQKLGEVLGFEVVDLFEEEDEAPITIPAPDLDKKIPDRRCRHRICRVIYRYTAGAA